MASSKRFAFSDQAELARHRALAGLNHRRLYPELPTADWRRDIVDAIPLLIEEGDYVEELRRLAQPGLAGLTSREPELLSWFAKLEQAEPGQHDALFDHLAEAATLEEMRWFLRQQLASEPGFDDQLALTQLHMPPRAKRELGRNFWFELGRGQETGMRGPMLAKLARRLDLAGTQEIVWESLALSNLLLALGYHRRYAHQSIGALGVIVQTAPGRAAKVDQGLQRLGLSAEDRQYFTLLGRMDVRRTQAWHREIVLPLAAETPALAIAIAEGAVMRLQAGARCWMRYRRQLGIHSRAA